MLQAAQIPQTALLKKLAHFRDSVTSAENTLTPFTETPLQFITDDVGTQVGVLLNMAEYHRLTQSINPDPECLIGLSHAELEALAMSKLSLPVQSRVNTLLAKNAEIQLSSDEEVELDNLLEQIDQLTTIKTRAQYTLYQYQKNAEMSGTA